MAEVAKIILYHAATSILFKKGQKLMHGGWSLFESIMLFCFIKHEMMKVSTETIQIVQFCN